MRELRLLRFLEKRSSRWVLLVKLNVDLLLKFSTLKRRLRGAEKEERGEEWRASTPREVLKGSSDIGQTRSPLNFPFDRRSTWEFSCLSLSPLESVGLELAIAVTHSRSKHGDTELRTSPSSSPRSSYSPEKKASVSVKIGLVVWQTHLISGLIETSLLTIMTIYTY